MAELPACCCIGVTFLAAPFDVLLNLICSDFRDRHPLEEHIELVCAEKCFLSTSVFGASGVKRIGMLFVVVVDQNPFRVFVTYPGDL